MMIFEPAAIKNMDVRNRFVRSATYDGMAARDGRVSDAQVALYDTLAEGGVGLIVTGLASVHPSGQLSGFQNTLYDDACIPGLKRLTDVAHGRGAKIALQLAHAGREAHKYMAWRKQDAIGPSEVIDDPYCTASCREMTEEDIEEVVAAFGTAARRAREAGFDAVQIHGAHAYLFSQFLSPFANRRTDRWGGPFGNRIRFLQAVYRRIRSRVGEDFPVTIKIGVADGFPGGLTFSEGLQAAVQCAQWGFDALEISQGLRGRFYAQTEFKTGIHRPGRDAYFRNWCKEVKARVGVPVMMVGGMRRLGQMEEILREGEADFVSLCRPLIREPELIRFWENDPGHHPTCISCNRCFDALLNLKPLACAVTDSL